MTVIKLYVTAADIRAAQRALRGPLDRHEATMMACGAAILAQMEGARLEFASSDPPLTVTVDLEGTPTLVGWERKP